MELQRKDMEIIGMQMVIDRLQAENTTLFEQHRKTQPRLTVRLVSFPESNGKRNWTAQFVRVDKWDGLVGSVGGITIAYGERWNRVAYEAERAKCLIGERDGEPCILDYSDDINTPDEWAGERSPGLNVTHHLK